MGWRAPRRISQISPNLQICVNPFNGERRFGEWVGEEGMKKNDEI